MLDLRDIAFTGAGEATFSGTINGGILTVGDTVSGFATGGNDMLDLRDIAFTGAGEATFSGTINGGILTVGDGSHTASIRLAGDYVGDTFAAATDRAGGVTVTATAPPGSPGVLPFIAAMAATPSAAAFSHASADGGSYNGRARNMLIAPRLHQA